MFVLELIEDKKIVGYGLQLHKYVAKLGHPKARGGRRLDVFANRDRMRWVVREGEGLTKDDRKFEWGRWLCKAEPRQDRETGKDMGWGPMGHRVLVGACELLRDSGCLPALEPQLRKEGQINFLKRQGHPPRTKSPIGRCNAKVPSQM